MTRPARKVLSRGAMIAGRYRVDRLLGRGGAAEVYSVRDEQRDRAVALKRLIAPLEPRGRSSRLSFEREYYTLTQLRHPHVVCAYDFGYNRARPFYTMQLLDGDDLRDLAPLPWRRVCSVLSDVASALALMHSRRLVHGDVSARNVRCARDGRATLIDFGTMSTIGAAGRLQGTPPHIAPELGTGQPVDERSDLYALGTLAYWLLCREHAYPVQTLRQLSLAWRVPPPHIATIANVPEAFGALIMSMIEPDPIARPDGAAEVIDRLNAIAGRASREETATAQAYLANPTLIQRQPQLARLVSALDAADRGRGASLVIRGEAGLGASRLLRELVLRAKTRGALVLSAAAGSDSGAFAVARVLARQLLTSAGATAAVAAEPHRDALGALLSGLGDHDALAPQPIERRAQLASALSEWFSTAAANRLVLIAVADLRLCDDASLGFLAALAAGAADTRLVIAATLGDDGPANPGLLDGLLQRSEALTLEALDRHGTRSLTESVFGRVPHVERLAELTHELCQGNPLQSLELARHLTQSGAVRYRDGEWSIPRDLTVRHLPSSLGAWFTSRVATLSGEARVLAELLAIRRGSLTVHECVVLMAARPEAVFAALDRLTMVRMVVVANDRVALAQDGLGRALRAELSDERRRDLHGRVGRALAARAFDTELGKLEAGYHLLRGGAPSAGANLIADAATDSAALFASTGAEVIEALEAALAEYDRTGSEPRRRMVVLTALIRCAFLLDPSLVRYADRVLSELQQSAGLTLGAELAARAPHEPRVHALQRAMLTAARRHSELPPNERGFNVFDAAEQLVLTGFSLIGVGINQLDTAAVERIARVIEPLGELGPTPAAAAHRLFLTVIDAMQGRQTRAQQGRHDFIAALSDANVFPGLSEGRRHGLIAAQMHGIGLLESLRGGDQGLVRAAELDAMGLKAFAPAAMQIRVLTHLFNGDERRADACRAQLDVLALQHAPMWHLDTWILPYLAGPYDLWGDVIGLKHAVAQLRPVAAAYPGYEPFLRFALGAYHRERGKLAIARSELEAALALAPAGTHVAWSPSIAAYVHTLVCARDYHGALEHGERAMTRARADGLAELWVCGRIEPQLAIARAHLGQGDESARRLDEFIRDSERAAMPRPMLGKCYEARALVATLAADREGFDEAARRAGVCFRATGNPKLIAAHERLWKTARTVRNWRPPRHGSQSDVVTM